MSNPSTYYSFEQTFFQMPYSLDTCLAFRILCNDANGAQVAFAKLRCRQCVALNFICSLAEMVIIRHLRSRAENHFKTVRGRRMRQNHDCARVSHEFVLSISTKTAITLPREGHK